METTSVGERLNVEFDDGRDAGVVGMDDLMDARLEQVTSAGANAQRELGRPWRATMNDRTDDPSKRVYKRARWQRDCR